MNISPHMVTVWHQIKAAIDRLFSGTPRPSAPSTPPSVPHLPSVPVEMIIAHLMYDTNTLKACSLTCRSWYSAAAPLLHHTITLYGALSRGNHGYVEPLDTLHDLGLLPLVKEIQVRQYDDPSPWFTHRELAHPAFANIHTLGIMDAQIHHLIEGGDTPCVGHNLAHLSPTLRSITLSFPCCTPRQLSRFLSYFSNLDDIAIAGIRAPKPETPVQDAEPIPSSTSKLRGRLALYCFRWVETLNLLSTSCGGLRFRQMNIDASCAPFLLEACAETVETLRFQARDAPTGR